MRINAFVALSIIELPMLISSLKTFTFRPCSLQRLTRCFSAKSSPDISSLRKEYSRIGLEESDLPQSPFYLFERWFDEAVAAQVAEPNAMCLSTCADNRPSARQVLLKGFDHRGFVLYTNYNSRKSRELIENPFAALTFFWAELERSIRIEGSVEKIAATESDKYFSSRPRNSQIGAWSSCQSDVIKSRTELEQQERDVIKRFDGLASIPRPEHWGGFRVRPTRMEFWKGRESRLHDRIVYSRHLTANIDDVTDKSNTMNDTDQECSHWELTRLQP